MTTGATEFELETLAYGYGLIEGPRVDADDALYFSDVTGGGVYRRDPSGEVTVAVPKRRGVGGIALHAEGGIVVSGRNICHVRNGETRIIFDNDAPGFNDLITDAQGRVLCGTMRSNPFTEHADRTPGEVHRIGPDGAADELYGDVLLTNGIGFSPSGDRIYHSDTARHHLICHDVDVEADRLVNRRSLAPSSASASSSITSADDFNPDGLAVDQQGTVWVADFGAGCVRGLDPDDGTEVARIDVPANSVTSLCFGGADRCDLYIVTADNTDDPSRSGTIFRTRVSTPGLPIPAATV